MPFKNYSKSLIDCQEISRISSVLNLVKRESDTRFSTSGFFHKSVYPGSLIITFVSNFRKKSKQSCIWDTQGSGVH